MRSRGSLAGRERETVLLYVSAFPEEIPTAPFLAMAYDAGKRVILPRVDRIASVGCGCIAWSIPDATCRLACSVSPSQRRRSPEVAADSIDWALIPGLAFDDRGYRLGRGAGHYDRLLPTMRRGLRLLGTLPGPVSSSPACPSSPTTSRSTGSPLPIGPSGEWDGRKAGAAGRAGAGRLIRRGRPAFPSRHRSEITPERRAPPPPLSEPRKISAISRRSRFSR